MVAARCVICFWRAWPSNVHFSDDGSGRGGGEQGGRREQPARQAKRSHYTDEELSQEKEERKEARHRYTAFEVDKPPPLRLAAIKEVGAAREQLAKGVFQADTLPFNGDIPSSMTFGPAGGCGAGFYDETGGVHRVGVGTFKWGIFKEIAPATGGRARHGASFFSVVEIINAYLESDYSRAGSKVLVAYYVNGTMINAYGMDPDGIIPAGLKQADIWFRTPAWLGFVEHTSIICDAIPFRPKLLDMELSRQSFAGASVGATPDRDGAWVAGGIKCNENLKVESWEPWVLGDPHFLDDHGPPTDAKHYVQLQPSPYNFFVAPPDEPPFTFQRLLMVDGGGAHRTIVISEDRAKQSTCCRWVLPADLKDPVVQADIVLPRERRNMNVINGALILDEMRRKPTPELTHAAPALVCHPRMLLFLESEPHTIFPSEWRLPQGGSLCQLRSPSVQEMLRSIRNDYFTPADLCERKVSHMLLHRLRQVLREVDAAYVTVDVPLELRELASLFCFELFELHGTVLTWSFAELTEAQEHAVVKRLFGTRGVRLVGPRRRIYYKILMAIGGRRGASVIEFDLRTRILSIKVGAHRFNENGVSEAGAAITPAVEPTVVVAGGTAADYRFDLVDLVWVKASKSIHYAAIAATYPAVAEGVVLPGSRLAAAFGMNGTQL